MAIHDAYARLTPYELLLPDPGFPDRCFAEIAREAEERGVNSGNPAAFVTLGAVRGALGELRAEDAGPESAHDHAGILFHAYHFWRCDGRVVLAGRETVHGLLAGVGGEGATVGRSGVAEPVGGEGSAVGRGESAGEGEAGWKGGLRQCAGYVQLPQHLVWIESPDQAPESVDGFFWYGDRGGVLHLAVVAGMRRHRPGYVVVSVPPQPLAAMPGWASGPAREGGGDFATSLPGAELDGLVGIRTPAEVFKVAGLLLGRFARDRSQAGAAAPDPAAEGSASASGPRPTRLPHVFL